jgi:hypothetical protein
VDWDLYRWAAINNFGSKIESKLGAENKGKRWHVLLNYDAGK